MIRVIILSLFALLINCISVKFDRPLPCFESFKSVKPSPDSSTIKFEALLSGFEKRDDSGENGANFFDLEKGQFTTNVIFKGLSKECRSSFIANDPVILNDKSYKSLYNHLKKENELLTVVTCKPIIIDGVSHYLINSIKKK